MQIKSCIYFAYLYIVAVNEPKHVLAVLRRILGLKQKEMANLVGCSTATIQAVEYGKLVLSEKLAVEVQQQTGVDLEWLLSNDVSKPVVNPVGDPYTKELFTQRQAFLKSSVGDLETNGVTIRFEVSRLVARLACGACAAIKAKKVALFAYKCGRALEDLQKEFGGDLARWPWAKRPFQAVVRDIERILEKDATESLEEVWRLADATVRKPAPGVPPSSKAPRRKPA